MSLMCLSSIEPNSEINNIFSVETHEEKCPLKINSYHLANYLTSTNLTIDTVWVVKTAAISNGRRFSTFPQNEYSPARIFLVIENVSQEEVEFDSCYSDSWKLHVISNNKTSIFPMLGLHSHFFQRYRMSAEEKLGIVIDSPFSSHSNQVFVVYCPSQQIKAISKISLPIEFCDEQKRLPKPTNDISRQNHSEETNNFHLSVMKIANFFLYTFRDRMKMPVIATRNDEYGTALINENDRFVPACFGLVVHNDSEAPLALPPFFSSEWKISVRYITGGVREYPLCTTITNQNIRRFIIPSKESVAVIFGFNDLYFEYDDISCINVILESTDLNIISNTLKL